jgi:hypothetical protein
MFRENASSFGVHTILLRQPRGIRRQIAATDKKIDELVYRLYWLTGEEIAIVEGKSYPPHDPPFE